MDTNYCIVFHQLVYAISFFGTGVVRSYAEAYDLYDLWMSLSAIVLLLFVFTMKCGMLLEESCITL